MNEDSTRVSPPAGPTPGPTPGPRPAPSPAPMPARIGAYTIERELGRGGMGVVYKALRADLRRVFALKTLLAGADAVPPEALDRFVREARAAASLAGHPNIVAVHDAGRDGNTFFIAMDFVDGPSLAALVAKEGVTTKRALAIAEDVANALHAAHEAGLVHRDVKPANVLIDARGTPRLTDFGLVRAADEKADGGRLTEAGAIMGTPAYMAPEQAAG
ncbi:MAG: serine/threonine-protein kinase, partial [Planctomycetota bacterium]